MGQKTDARIFRQGVNKKNWELKHIEKNNEESSLYLYKTLEIQKYLNRFFGLYKIKIHNCKIFYSDSSLQIFVSFYVTTKTFYVIKKNVTKYSKEFSTEFHPVLSNEQKKNWKKKNWKKIKNESLQFKPLLSSMKKLKMKNLQKVNKSKNASFNRLKKY